MPSGLSTSWAKILENNETLYFIDVLYHVFSFSELFCTTTESQFEFAGSVN